jgi:phospholipase/carboxylesterase
MSFYLLLMQSLRRLKALTFCFPTLTRSNQIFSMQTKSLATTDCSQFEDIGSYFKEDRESTDKYVILHPKDKDEATRHKYSIIWLHGLGDSAYGFSDVFEDERIGLVPTTCKVIIPTAPMRAVTCNMGSVMTSWCDILELRGSHTMSKEENLNAVS